MPMLTLIVNMSGPALTGTASACRSRFAMASGCSFRKWMPRKTSPLMR